MKDISEKVLSSKNVYKGSIINVVKEHVKLPMNEGTSTRDIVEHAKGVAALLITNDNKMVLEKQWREPVKKVTIEIPAGKVDSRDNGSSHHAMLRELNEEVRIKPKVFKHLYGFYTSPGFTNEYLDMYLAKDLVPVKNKKPRDKGENLHLFTVSLPEALKLIKDNKLQDAKSVDAVNYWHKMTLENKLKSLENK